MSDAPGQLSVALTARVLMVDGVARVFPPSLAAVLGAAIGGLSGSSTSPEVGVDEDRQAVTIVLGLNAASTAHTASEVHAAVASELRRLRPAWEPTITVTVSSIGSD